MVFLRLGLTSFGGPVAHVGYFRREFVEKRRWLDEHHFGQLLALCQCLPGPASSQLGFSIGLLRAGWLGALAAFVGFTLPSALLLFVFALMSGRLSGSLGQALIHGLKLVAVAVVAQGVVAMARALCPDWPRALMAGMSAALIALVPGMWTQCLVVALGAAIGLGACRRVERREGEAFALPYGVSLGAAIVAAYLLLLGLALVCASGLSALGQAGAAFYRTGALVFGGGHVVLPLLKQSIVDPGWITSDQFLSGYGAAQAVPGPMFSVAAFLGAKLQGSHGGVMGATVAVLAIFLPGLLAVSGALPFWQTLAARRWAIRMLAGVNAAVVGLLAFALYNPVWVSAIHTGWDICIALIAFAALTATRCPPLLAVAWCVGASMTRALLAG